MEFIENFFLSKYSQEKLIKWFRQICIAEAISWLLLFSAMIWIREDKEGILPIIYISVMGSIHGLFFTLYLILAFPCRKIYQWMTKILYSHFWLRFFRWQRFGLTKNWQNLRENKDLTFKIL